jgi:glycosyltransferase involved in cell wall biosynthesis
MVWVCHEPSAFIHSIEMINALRPFWKKWLAKCLQPLLKMIDLQLVGQGDRVLANSFYTAGQFERVYGRKVDGIACPGIDTDLFFPGGKKRDCAIITVAHLVPYKRIDFLLQVFSRLRMRHQCLVFHVVGEGPSSGELQVLASDLGIANSVVFHGNLQHVELAALNRRMLLFLFAGVNETFGMAPLEAIASGTPVVAHRSGGPREFVNEKCGWLIDSLDLEDWTKEVSACIDHLLARGSYPEEISQCARNFTWRESLRPALEVIAGLMVEDN